LRNEKIIYSGYYSILKNELGIVTFIQTVIFVSAY